MPFVLRAVAGACAGRPATHAAAGAAARGALIFLFWGVLLRLDWELREGRLKIARGRSWRPEIGMEHASRGRRSGNKGVGARWRGRFRIFSARHCSRTKVSHAENSGMTTVFFLWGLLRCRGEWEREHEGGLIRCAGRPREWSCGAVPPQERWHEGLGFVFWFGGFFHMLGSGQTRMPPQRHEGFWFFVWGIVSHAQERWHGRLVFFPEGSGSSTRGGFNPLRGADHGRDGALKGRRGGGGLGDFSHARETARALKQNFTDPAICGNDCQSV